MGSSGTENSLKDSGDLDHRIGSGAAVKRAAFQASVGNITKLKKLLSDSGADALAQLKATALRLANQAADAIKLMDDAEQMFRIVVRQISVFISNALKDVGSFLAHPLEKTREFVDLLLANLPYFLGNRLALWWIYGALVLVISG